MMIQTPVPDFAFGAGTRNERVDRGLKRTTDAMRRGLGRAVVDLRARMRWGQTDLADEISKGAARRGLTIKPNQVCVSRWENCETAPSQQHRMVLAKIATKNGRQDLAEFFRAPVSAWRLVGYVKLGLMKDEE
jgi:hypothetical protein